MWNFVTGIRIDMYRVRHMSRFFLASAALHLGVLVALGYGSDPHLAEAWRWLLDKQDAQGRWKLENALNGKMWIDIEKKGRPSKWITLRALRALKAVA